MPISGIEFFFSHIFIDIKSLAFSFRSTFTENHACVKEIEKPIALINIIIGEKIKKEPIVDTH